MNRIKQIDVLRAIAVFLVLGRHMDICPANLSPFLNQVTTMWFQGGWTGVDLFFVLSGFLVSGLLFREYERFGKLEIGRFLIRRGFKIYPPFWLLIISTVLIQRIIYGDLDFKAIFSEMLFVQNYGHHLWNHTWSLAVEEHFYLLLALLFYCFANRQISEPLRFIPVSFITTAVTCLLLRIILYYNAPYKNETHLFPTHLRLDSLLFGVLLSYCLHHCSDKFTYIVRRFRYIFAGLGVLLFLPAFCSPLGSAPFIFTFGLTFFYLGGGSLLIAALGSRSSLTGIWSALPYVGSHSYSIYLWHMPVCHWGTSIVKTLLPQYYNWYVYASFYLIGSVIFGIGMAVLIEFPILRIRDHFFPSRSSPFTSTVTEV